MATKLNVEKFCAQPGYVRPSGREFKLFQLRSCLRQLNCKSRLDWRIESLDPIEVEIISMRHFEGLQNNAVAGVLQMEASTVNSRYIRALRKLRSELARHVDFASGESF